eukprot:3507058-Rhodomonas_salina.1
MSAPPGSSARLKPGHDTPERKTVTQWKEGSRYPRTVAPSRNCSVISVCERGREELSVSRKEEEEEAQDEELAAGMEDRGESGNERSAFGRRKVHLRLALEVVEHVLGIVAGVSRHDDVADRRHRTS